MTYWNKKLFGAALLCALSMATPASAQTSDWVQGFESFRVAGRLERQGKIVTKIECKDSGKKSLDYDSALVRLTYTENTKQTEWTISGWNNLPELKKHFEGKGYKMVSQTMFVRQKSGLRLYCGIFHK